MLSNKSKHTLPGGIQAGEDRKNPLTNGTFSSSADFTLTSFEFVICREEETKRTIKLDTWRKITEKSSTAIADSRSKLDGIMSKDPLTEPEMQEQLEEIQVKTTAT